MKEAALNVLKGVGDSTLGEWIEVRPKAFHIRRRLSATEEALTGPAIDIRGTDEALKRAEVVVRQCPHIPRQFILEELGI